MRNASRRFGSTRKGGHAYATAGGGVHPTPAPRDERASGRASSHWFRRGGGPSRPVDGEVGSAMGAAMAASGDKGIGERGERGGGESLNRRRGVWRGLARSRRPVRLQCGAVLVGPFVGALREERRGGVSWLGHFAMRELLG